MKIFRIEDIGGWGPVIKYSAEHPSSRRYGCKSLADLIHYYTYEKLINFIRNGYFLRAYEVSEIMNHDDCIVSFDTEDVLSKYF